MHPASSEDAPSIQWGCTQHPVRMHPASSEDAPSIQWGCTQHPVRMHPAPSEDAPSIQWGCTQHPVRMHPASSEDAPSIQWGCTQHPVRMHPASSEDAPSIQWGCTLHPHPILRFLFQTLDISIQCFGARNIVAPEQSFLKCCIVTGYSSSSNAACTNVISIMPCIINRPKGLLQCIFKRIPTQWVEIHLLCSEPYGCISWEVQSSTQPTLCCWYTILSMEIQFHAENPRIHVLLGRATKRFWWFNLHRRLNQSRRWVFLLHFSS